MKEIKMKDVWEYFNPHLKSDDVLMLFVYAFFTIMCIVIVDSSTKLNPEHFIRDCIIAVSGLYSLIIILYFGLIGKVINRIGNITIFKGDENDN